MNDLTTAEILQILQFGTVEIEGILPWSSNYAFLVQICQESLELEAVYKPRKGERPLWDFAQGTLCLREMSAFLLSQSLNWPIIPPTTLRKLEHGLGSVQLFIDHNPEHHYFTLEGDPTYYEQIQKFVLLDIIINNADRKAGHVLVQKDNNLGDTERLWSIDHGICFHSEYKLRSVIWEFAGQKIPTSLMEDLKNFKGQFGENHALHQQLQTLLSKSEIEAINARLNHLLEQKIFPHPGSGRHYPWPPV